MEDYCPCWEGGVHVGGLVSWGVGELVVWVHGRLLVPVGGGGFGFGV